MNKNVKRQLSIIKKIMNVNLTFFKNPKINKYKNTISKHIEKYKKIQYNAHDGRIAFVRY